MTHFSAAPRDGGALGRLVAWLPFVGMLMGFGLASFVLLVPGRVSYALTDLDVVADVRWGPLQLGERFPRAAVTGARRFHVERAHRVAGTAKPGLCVGRFHLGGLGPAWLATTCADDAVRFNTGERLVVLAPAAPEAFLDALGSGRTGTFPAAAGEDGGARWPTLLGWLLMVVQLPVLARLAWLLLRPLRYELRTGTLRVPSYFGAVEVPLRGARFHEGDMQGWRAAGVAVPGFYLGRFREDGRGFHAAATRKDRGVWVEAEGSVRVFITPESVSAFTVALETNGAVRELHKA